MIAKPTLQQCFDVVKQCIAHLSENCSHEKGLFRIAPSVNEVRKLKSVMCEGRLRSIGDGDSHVVAGVLLSTLKDMEPPLLHDIRNEILDIDTSDESGENFNGIARRISLLPSQKIEIHLANTPGNDSNTSQLITALSPTICRPPDTSYMSIRHVELLKHVRPVLQFIAEHSTSIFGVVGPSRYRGPSGGGRHQTGGAPTAPLGRPRSSSSGEDSDSDMSTSRGGGGLRGSSGSGGGGGAALPAPSQSFHQLHHLSLHSNSMMDVETGVEEQASASTSVPLHAPVPNYSSWEWRVLEALACSRVQNWLARPGGGGGWGAGVDEQEHSGRHKADRRAASSSSPVQCLQSHFGGRESSGMDDLRLCDSDEDGEVGGGDCDSRPGSSAKKGYGQGRGSLGARAAGGVRAEARRRLIAECKGLRQEIQRFEDKWHAEHNRHPQAQDRGLMQGTYGRYKELKRRIRDQAASDIQRVLRGCLARARVRTLMESSEGGGGERGGAMEQASGDVDSCNNVTTVHMCADQKKPSNGWLQESERRREEDREELRGGAEGSRLSPAGEDSSTTDLKSRYKECMEVKKTLKRNLKKFDDDFTARKGRAPRKADKEVMRPQYQKYHEIRAELDKLKVEITRALGHFPAELEDAALSGGLGSRGPSPAWSDNAEHNLSSMSTESEDACGGGGFTADPDEVGESSGLKIQSPLVQNRSGSSATIPGTAPSKNSLDSLVTEKKQLHAYLKAFEKEFNRVNGRHVMHPEDIKPVADEYQRYKELKKVLKELRSTL